MTELARSPSATATLPARRQAVLAPRRAAHRARHSGSGTPRRALVHFALAGVVTVVLIAVAGAFISRTVAEGQALADARRVNGVVARTVVEPQLRDGLLTGDPAAIAAMRETARLLTDGPVLRLKLWAPDGRVVFSDDERLIGRQFALEHDEAEVLVTGDAAAEISDMSRAENDLEHDLGTLVEVYRPVHTPSGQVLLFETYMPLSSLAARTSAVWLQFLPITVGALVLLQLVQFPLAVRLARQTARARRERELMLHRSLAASDAERRRIAADLHDGVVQDLAATSMVLAGAGAAVEADRAGSRAESGRLHVAADAVRGVAATLVVDDGATRRLGCQAEQFAFRVAQEALRNVVAHAEATSVELRLSRRAVSHGDLLTLVVTDDGRGFDPVAGPLDDRPHMGLQLLHDLAGDVGGRIEVSSARGAGTIVTMEVPVS